MFFYFFFALLVFQRVGELVIAKKNEKWMVKRGALEHGQEHYPFIVLLHIAFLLSLFLEVILFEKQIVNLWYFVIALLAITQLIRYWALISLGQYWNTKIMIVPNDVVVCKGPYRFIRHPNYIVVAIELLFIPLLFQAYATAIIFTLLNIGMMTIRIPAEEKALSQHTNYLEVFKLSQEPNNE
ncbi:isoprenylcysteine carboxyl methyltransferase family protein [Bacillus weihaiensis]|uniref:isoprenylcysteine carboxyl methyltransferase family protein n=1 Tax=Bacillus weihaiensis TaxID=1547283 RepID=UPI002357D92C|nr:isoprenylcysteine carboxylmethyltransferase family protein [Bacillus weihaiensis]